LRGLQPRRSTVNRRHAQDASTPHSDSMPNASICPPEPHPPSLHAHPNARGVAKVVYGQAHGVPGVLQSVSIMRRIEKTRTNSVAHVGQR
jgi:hypothetical protein